MLIEGETRLDTHVEIQESPRILVVTDKARNRLSRAEVEIVECFARGMHRVSQISSIRMSAKNTTASQLSKLYRDFNVSSKDGRGAGTEGQKTHLFLEFLKNGFISLKDSEISDGPIKLSLSEKADSLFTNREIDVLNVILEGDTTHMMIAEKLIISKATAKNHMARLQAKSGGADRGREGIIGMLVTLIEQGVIELKPFENDYSNYGF